MSFSPVFWMLEQEGHIVRSFICTGLTELNHAQIHDKGRYYTAFSCLSLGLERLAKIAIILDHMVAHDLRPPGGSTVRGYGHDLVALFGEAERLAWKHQYPMASSFTLEPLTNEILLFFASFAEDTRYANLDALASGSQTKDPLSLWGDILGKVAAHDVPERARTEILRQGALLASALQDSMIVHQSGLDGTPMELEEWLSIPRLHRKANQYASWRITQLYSLLSSLVSSLAASAQGINIRRDPRVTHIPYMNEFFNFIPSQKQDVLRKRRWP